MRTALRFAVAGYIVMLTLALLAGRWPLQGPVILSIIRGHGVHVGDALVLLVSASVSIAVLTGRP